MKNNIKKWINFYTNEGLNVLPAKHKHKSPAGFKPPLNWKQYENKHPDKKQIKSWMMQNKYQNIFAILGNISNNIIEIDVDAPNTPLSELFNNPKQALENVWVAKSSQGKKKIYARGLWDNIILSALA